MQSLWSNQIMIDHASIVISLKPLYQTWNMKETHLQKATAKSPIREILRGEKSSKHKHAQVLGGLRVHQLTCTAAILQRNPLP